MILIPFFSHLICSLFSLLLHRAALARCPWSRALLIIVRIASTVVAPLWRCCCVRSRRRTSPGSQRTMDSPVALSRTSLWPAFGTAIKCALQCASRTASYRSWSVPWSWNYALRVYLFNTTSAIWYIPTMSDQLVENLHSLQGKHTLGFGQIWKHNS